LQWDVARSRDLAGILRGTTAAEGAGMHDMLRSVPKLTPEREAFLVAQAQTGSDAAKREIVAAHLRMVHTIARRVTPKTSDDVLAEGTLGLVEALERFDPTVGARFSTYAAHWVRALVTRHVLANRRIVAAPSTRAARKVLAGLGRAERRLAAATSSPTAWEIADELGVGTSDVEEVLASVRARDLPIGPVTATTPSFEPASESDSPEDAVVRAEERSRAQRALSEAMAQLSERERRIVEARALADEARTLDDLAAELRISRERVRQIERRALERLEGQLRRAA
jgi:RNA polymerase sigma-32 factor